MIQQLRDALNISVRRWEPIAEATGIELNDLRRFALGTYLLESFELDLLPPHLGLALRPHSDVTLPFEHAVAYDIQMAYADDFAFSKKMIQQALQLLGARSNGTGNFKVAPKKKGMNRASITLATGIFTKIIKQYRSLVALCEIGQGEDAGIIQRSMFETHLALQFILRANVPLAEHGKKVADLPLTKPAKLCTKCKHPFQPEKKFPKLSKMSTRLRCAMYVSHIYNEHEKELNEAQRAGTSDCSKEDEKIIRAVAKKGRRTVGKGWYGRQDQTGNYSGLSIRDLARTFKLEQYMASPYRRQSHSVHGLDVFSFFDFTNTKRDMSLNLGPSPAKIKERLRVSTALFIGSISLLNHRFGLGIEKEIKSHTKEHFALNKVPDPLDSLSA